MNPSEIGPIVPIIGAIVALLGTAVAMYKLYKDREDRKEDRREREHQQEIENKRAQDSKLEAFRDQIAHSDTYRELRTAPASGHKRAVLRAKLQTLVHQVDGEHKGELLSFLHGAKLIRKQEITPYEYTKEARRVKDEERWKYPILTLYDMDFSQSELNPGTKLTFDDLRGIILRGAKLSEVNLSGANLRNADLSDADLSGAQLRKANEDVSEKIPGEWYNEYRKAVRGRSASGLLETDSILEIDLSGAKLSRANLSKANLSKANLRYADLSGADLRGAVGITNEELEQQAKSLKGAIMPDGSKHP